MPETLYRQKRFCQEFAICRNTLRKWRQEGWVREVKVGRIILIDPSPLFDSSISEKLKMIALRARAGL